MGHQLRKTEIRPSAGLVLQALSSDYIHQPEARFKLKMLCIRVPVHAGSLTRIQSSMRITAGASATSPNNLSHRQRAWLSTSTAAMATMKALVYAAKGQPRLEDRPKPTILKPTDAIVKMVKTTICGASF